MRVLGIETSCDETAVSLIEASGDFKNDFRFQILGHALLSQAKEHARYGGVFPAVAKREHGRNLVPILTEALRQAHLLTDDSSAASEAAVQKVHEFLARDTEMDFFVSQFLQTYAKPNIDCIAVTTGPGLEPALWMGINLARALAEVWNIPVVAVNHMEAHIVMAVIQKGELAPFEFPLISLLVSGGHTELVLSREWMHYELIGQTRDDAAGEAFDKVARLLGLEYPGGPEITKYARVARDTRLVPRFKLPRPMLRTNDYDFSFAGLKTAVRTLVQSNELTDEFRQQIALEFENAVVDVLVEKTMRAIDEHNAHALAVGGGVSANETLRHRLAEALKDGGEPARLLLPPPELATDNAIMIALAGYFHALKKEFSNASSIRAEGNLRLS